MTDTFNIKLSPAQIEELDFYQAEEKLVYIRYLLIREQREEIIMKYYFYLELLEQKLKSFKTEVENPLKASDIKQTRS